MAAAPPVPPPPPGAGLGATAVAGAITAATGAASHVDCLIDPESAIVCQIRGTWAATLVFEGTLNPADATWPTVRANDVAHDLLTTAPAANGLYVLYCAGYAAVRVRCTAFTSGSVTVTFRASPGAGVYLPGSAAGINDILLGGGGAVTIADGADVVLGHLADAAVGDAAGTINAHLRSVAKSLLAALVVTEADGANIALGHLADAAVGDASGSLNAHLRQLAKALTDVWDSANHRLYVANVPGGFVNVTQGTSPWVVTDAATETVLGALADAAVGDASGSINAHLRQIAKTLAAGLATTPPAGVLYTGVVDATHATFDVTLAGLGSATAQINGSADQALFLQGSNDGSSYQPLIGYEDWAGLFQTGPPASDSGLTPRLAGSSFNGGMFTLPAGWHQLRFWVTSPITTGSYDLSVWESAGQQSVVTVNGGHVNVTAYGGAEATFTANGQLCSVHCQGASTLVVDVQGTFTGTIAANVQGGLDDDLLLTPGPGAFVNLTDGAISSTITAPGTYQFDCAGFIEVDLVAGGGWTGSATIEAAADCGLRAAVLGQATDVAVTGDNPGTLSAKLRGLAQLLGSVWDTGNGWLRSAVQGMAAAGAAVAGNPVLMGGTDGTHARSLKLNPDGTLPVGGFTVAPQGAFAVNFASGAAYAAGQAIGNIAVNLVAAVRAGPDSGAVQTVVLQDKDKQNAPIDLVFFNAAPTAPTDHATYAPSATDLGKMIGVVSILAADYASFSANSVATKTATGLGIVPTSTTLYCIAVCRGTPTYTLSSSLNLICVTAQD